MPDGHFPVRLQTSTRSFGLLSPHAPESGVIFVHGFKGNPSTTWVDFEHLVDGIEKYRDSWSKCDLFFYGYASHNQVRPLAESFLEFLKYVATRNEQRLIKSNLPLPSVIQNVSAIATGLLAQRGKAKYRNLTLVGHSTGAVIIRQAILLHLKQVRTERPDFTAWVADQKTPDAPDFGDQLIVRAFVRLFAPAHLGVLAAGNLGRARSVPIIREIVDAYLRCNPLYQSLKQGSQTLLDIRRETEELYENNKVECLRASSLFGYDEEIVVIGGYEHDHYSPTEAGQNHTSVCKPKRTYLKPLEFVTNGHTFANRA